MQAHSSAKHSGFTIPGKFLFEYADRQPLPPHNNTICHMLNVKAHIMVTAEVQHLLVTSAPVEGNETLHFLLREESDVDEIPAKRVEKLQAALTPNAIFRLRELYNWPTHS